MNKNKIYLHKIKDFSFGFVFALFLFASIAAYAQQSGILQQKWQAIWHGTDWIDTGKTIKAKEIAENLEWLKKRVDEISNSTTTNVYNFNNEQSRVVAGCAYNILPNNANKVEEICWGDAYSEAYSYYNNPTLGQSLTTAWLQRGKIYTAKCPSDTVRIYTGIPIQKCVEETLNFGCGDACEPSLRCGDAYQSAICVKVGNENVTRDTYYLFR